MIVVDASAIVDLLLQTTDAALVEERMSAHANDWHAPHLIDLEVAHAVRRHAAAGVIDGPRGRQILTRLFDLRLMRYPHERLMPRIWDLRHNITAYDAAYIALAEWLCAPLLTRDHRLANAGGHTARIEVI